MKHFHPVVFSCLAVAVFFSACIKKKRESNACLSEKPGFKKPSLLILFDPSVQKLVLTDEGVLRGVDFDTNLEEVRKTEDVGNLTEVKNGLLVRVDLGGEESAEVTFYKKGGEQVGHISADVYLKDASSVQRFIKQYTAYLDVKYGTRTDHADGAATWEIPGGHHISLKKFGEGEEPGVEIESF